MNARTRFLAALIALSLTVSVAWLAVGGLSSPAGSQEGPIIIKRAHAGSHRVVPSKPVFMLVLGSDAGAPRYRRGGSVERGRSDSIHLIAINPVKKAATIVGIPRDSYVPIPGSGSNKINAAMAFGGPDLVVRTVEQLASVTIDYYMVAGFDDFAAIIDEFGGVPVTIPYSIQDSFSGANFTAGRRTLTGAQALAFSRARHGTPRGDFSRSENQGSIMLGTLTKARSEVAKNPGRTLNYIRALLARVKTDVGIVESMNLGLLALSLSPSSVRNIVLPGETGATPAGSSVILTSEARTILANVADDGLIN